MPRPCIVLPQPSAEALAASVIGGVGAGYRVEDAVIADADEGAPGVVRLALGPRTGSPEREPTLGSASDPGRRSRSRRSRAAVADIAVAVMQLRGEPTAFERLLGEVLVGLDHLGHLRRLVGVTEERADSTGDGTSCGRAASSARRRPNARVERSASAGASRRGARRPAAAAAVRRSVVRSGAMPARARTRSA